MTTYHRICVTHLATDKTYISDAKPDVTKDDLSAMETFLEAAASGKLTYFSFVREKQKILIPKQILAESVITLECYEA
jgi:hypothetical protein